MTEEVAQKFIRTFLAEGGSVCPFAKNCPLLFVGPNLDPAPVLRAFTKGQAVIPFTTRNLGGFAATREWARQEFLRLVRAVVAVDFSPGANVRNLANKVARDLKPALYDERRDSLRPNIALRGEPLITVCMAPVYPRTHPRYAPVAMLVVTWASDVEKAGVFPKVRAAMEREHGYVYDAIELMLPLPGEDPWMT